MVIKIIEGVSYSEPDTLLYFGSEPYLENEIEVDTYSEPEIITVDGKDYDISGLTGLQKITITFLAKQYTNVMSQEYRDTTPFDVHVYKVSKVKILRILFDPIIDDDYDDYDDDDDIKPWIEDVLDIDPDSVEFQLKLWLNEQMLKYKAFKERAGILIPISIGIGAIGFLLIGYQYSKSYVSEKGKVKARGK